MIACHSTIPRFADACPGSLVTVLGRLHREEVLKAVTYISGWPILLLRLIWAILAIISSYTVLFQV